MLICKLFGSFFIIYAASYLALQLNKTIENRNKELRQLYGILLKLKSEIQYMCNTLPECFEKISKSESPPFDKWLFELSNKMKDSTRTTFQEIWMNGLNTLDKVSFLNKEDLNLLNELSDKLGNSDTSAQIKAIDYVLLNLEKERTNLENEIKQKKKVNITICVFCGFMMMILLI